MNNLKLVLKENNEKTTFKVGNIEVGKDFLLIAGPCSVDNEEQIIKTALGVKKAGANMLRGGAYKPRTSPYAFQGLGRKGLEYLKNASNISGLPIVTEVVDTRDVYLVAEFADVLQVGARNMQNFALLQEVGKCGKPVLLKRGMYATLEEWLNAAEYILKEGNKNVILCERGIRTFETYTRNTLDISAISAIKNLTHLPIIADPSHATGRIELLEPMSKSCVVAGADGLMLEVNYHPEASLCDAKQALNINQFEQIANSVSQLYNFTKKTSCTEFITLKN